MVDMQTVAPQAVDLLTESDLSRELTPKQYSDLFCSATHVTEDPAPVGQPDLHLVRGLEGPNARVECDRLRSMQAQQQTVRGIVSVNIGSKVRRQVVKRPRASDQSGDGAGTETGGSHGGQLEFRPKQAPLVATQSYTFPLPDRAEVRPYLHQAAEAANNNPLVHA